MLLPWPCSALSPRPAAHVLRQQLSRDIWLCLACGIAPTFYCTCFTAHAYVLLHSQRHALCPAGPSGSGKTTLLTICGELTAGGVAVRLLVASCGAGGPLALPLSVQCPGLSPHSLRLSPALNLPPLHRRAGAEAAARRGFRGIQRPATDQGAEAAGGLRYAGKLSLVWETAGWQGGRRPLLAF